MFIRLFVLFIGLVAALAAAGQNVATFLTQPGTTFEAITWAPNGAIYTVDFNNGKVYRLDTNANIREIGDYGSVLGGAVDADNNFYCSEFIAGQIIKFDPDNNATVYASGLAGPAGILIDTMQQIMYVANYNGNRISKIDMTSNHPTPETLVQGQGLNGPDGLEFSPDGDLISANFNDNRLHRITPNGQIEQFSLLTGSQNSGYLVRRGDQYLITGAGTPKIFQVSLTGEVSTLAGQNMVGTADGNLSEAAFNFPNGIAMSPDGDSLLITESTASGRIRLITGLGNLTNTEQISILQHLRIYPNPTSEYLNVDFVMPAADSLMIKLLDIEGKLIKVLLNRSKKSGRVQETFQLPSNLNTGTYMIQLVAGNWQHTEQVQLTTN